MKRAVEQLKKENVEGIMIDLRNNGGGSMLEVQFMGGLFIPKGMVSQGRMKDSLQLVDMYKYRQVLWDGPLAVLINEGSASASEMFSGAMQDYGRAVIVGSPASYGKGTIQEFQPMGRIGNKELGTPGVSYGSINVTTGRFYRVTGVPTQVQGVRPDVVLPGKGAWNILRENQYSSALRPDTIAALPFERWKDSGKIQTVAAKGQARATADTALTAIRESVQWLIAHQKTRVRCDTKTSAGRKSSRRRTSTGPMRLLSFLKPSV